MESSSDSSADEEDVLKNFDEEAKLIVQTETLPKKSSDRYLLVYDTYKKWQEEHKNCLSNSDENNLIVYFNSLKAKLKPPTLWSIWSMLRKTLNTKDNVDISKFLNLKSLIKNNAKGYKPKKSFVLKWDQIMKFMTEAPDQNYLATKVVLTFGICGALRCDEITNIKVKDVQDLKDKFLVSVDYNKNDYAGQFIIGNLFYDTVKKYISLRPPDQFSERFFIQYQNGRCTRQTIGKNKIGEMPGSIACYLKLENVKRYTGHCFRRTSATLLSESGANMQQIKQLGRWRSDIIAQGYIENSLHNRQLIFNGITHENSKTKSKPSTSTEVTTKPTTEESESNYNLDGLDFSEDFSINNFDTNPGGVTEGGFNTASNKRIFTPPSKNEPSVPSGSKLFHSKPPLQLKQLENEIIQPPNYKKKKILQDSDNLNDNVSSIPKKNSFENCTFINCNFHFYTSKYDKENSQ